MLIKEKQEFKLGIVGRPNVGKSTMYNKLTRSRRALVKDEPGVTRDVRPGRARWWGQEFLVFDTGGLTGKDDPISEAILKTTKSYIEDFNYLVLVVDGRAGRTPEDDLVYEMVKTSGIPFSIIVNKIDEDYKKDDLLADFYHWGEDLLACSLESNMGLDFVIEEAFKHFKKDEIFADPTLEKDLRLAIVGKPNVGKSSLLNKMLGEDRFLVSPIAGTTVDAVQVQVTLKDTFCAISDTAGLRRKAKIEPGVEKLSTMQTQRAIRSANICLLVIDVNTGPTEQDAKILQMIQDEHVGVLIVANKIDDMHNPAPRKLFLAQIQKEFHFARDLWVCFVSAKTGKGLDKLKIKVLDYWGKMNTKLSTSELNNFFQKVIRQAPAPVFGTKDVKFYYITQSQQIPPSFMAFANEPRGVIPSYKRFVIKRMKEHWDLQGVPMRLYALKKGQSMSKAATKKEHTPIILDDSNSRVEEFEIS